MLALPGVVDARNQRVLGRKLSFGEAPKRATPLEDGMFLWQSCCWQVNLAGSVCLLRFHTRISVQLCGQETTQTMNHGNCTKALSNGQAIETWSRGSEVGRIQLTRSGRGSTPEGCSAFERVKPESVCGHIVGQHVLPNG